METKPEKTILKMIDQGLEYISLNNSQKAEEEFEAIINLDPTNGLAYYNLGVLACGKKKYKDALKFIEQCLKYTPNNVDAIIYLGISLKGIVKINEMQIRKAQALNLNGEDIQSFKKAFSLLDRKNYQEADRLFDSITRNNDQNIEVLRYIARMYNIMGFNKQALNLCNRIVQLKPDLPVTYYDKFVIYRKIDPFKALDSLDKVINLYWTNLMGLPSYAQLLVLKGILCNELPDNTEAINTFEQALNFRPNSDFIYASIAKILVRQGKLDEALEKIEKALKIDSSKEYYLQLKLGIVTKLKDKNEILSTLDRLLKLDPSKLNYLIDKGAILEELGKDIEAQKIYDTILKTNPNHIWTLRRKLSYYRKQGKGKEEQKTLEKIQKLVDKYPESGKDQNDAIVIKEVNDRRAITKEYIILDERFGKQNEDWFFEKQKMISDNNKTYDILSIKLNNGEQKDIYFDITLLMGKNLAFEGSVNYENRK